MRFTVTGVLLNWSNSRFDLAIFRVSDRVIGAFLCRRLQVKVGLEGGSYMRDITCMTYAPAEETVRAYLKGKRPIPFERARVNVLSYLLAIEVAFPGAQAYFFTLCSTYSDR